MPVVTARYAKAHLSQLLTKVRSGEEVVITKEGRPIARLVPVHGARPRHPGALKEQIALTPAFFEPLPADELAAWSEG